MSDDGAVAKSPLAARDARGRFLKGTSPGREFKPGPLHPRVIDRKQRDLQGKRRDRSRRRFSEDLRESAFDALDFLGRVMGGKVKATSMQIAIAHRLIEFAYGKEALMDAFGRKNGKAPTGKAIIVVNNVPRSPFKKPGGV